MSNIMRALVRSRAEPGIWMEDVPVREVGPNDVLIRVEARGGVVSPSPGQGHLMV